VHDEAYVERVREQSEGVGGVAGSETPFGRGSYEIALLAAGGAIAAVDAVVEGRVDNAYALVRPPGHHALADTGLGFCIFANVAVAVRDAQARHGIERIAIVDWDVHHGNGTQAAFWDDPSVLAVSIHQDGGYPPDSGGVHERGGAAAEGATVNIPLPPGSGSGAYLAAFDRVVIPALDRFEPQLIVVASGFDAGGLDPIGRMLLPAATFGELTLCIRDAAERHCGGRLVLSHEGGYSSGHVPFCGLAVVEALSGLSAGIEDPFAFLADVPGQELQPHQEAVLDAATGAL
jgi:acetoin utilization deacetylase AcuC-like enzyme